MSFLFVDVRGSTSIAETIAPLTFSTMMNSFYARASEALVEHGAFIDKLVGDEVVSHFLPCFAGANTAAAAVGAARDLLEAAPSDDEGVAIGIGVHTGIAYFGTVTAADGAFSDLTALGDSVNVAARLASKARAGEAVISRVSWDTATDEQLPPAKRRLRLKGRSEAIDTVVLARSR